MSEQTQSDPILTMYGHPACPQVPPLRAALKRAKVPYAYVNIHENYEARQRVRDINAGNESVPTLVFADGATLTEPSTGELQRELKARGYRLDALAWLAANAISVITLIVLALAILRAFGVF